MIVDGLTRAESALIARRRRMRNRAMLLALILVMALFYAITLVKLAKA